MDGPPGSRTGTGTCTGTGTGTGTILTLADLPDDLYCRILDGLSDFSLLLRLSLIVSEHVRKDMNALRIKDIPKVFRNARSMFWFCLHGVDEEKDQDQPIIPLVLYGIVSYAWLDTIHFVWKGARAWIVGHALSEYASYEEQQNALIRYCRMWAPRSVPNYDAVMKDYDDMYLQVAQRLQSAGQTALLQQFWATQKDRLRRYDMPPVRDRVRFAAQIEALTDSASAQKNSTNSSS